MINPFEEIAENANRQPHALAIQGPYLDLTWEEFIESARKIAQWLRSRGFKQGDMALLSLSPETEVAAMLAIMHEGGASAHYAKNISEVDLPACGFRFLITGDQNLNEPGLETLVLSPAAFPSQEELVSLESRGFESGNSIARVIFSSGTTGTPKAIPVAIEDVVSRVRAFDQEIIQGKKFMSFLSYDVSLGYITAMSDLLNGRCHLIAGPQENALRLAMSSQIELIAMSPITLKQMTEWAKFFRERPAWNVETIVTAGGPVDFELSRQASQTLGVELASIYGSTEVGLVALRQGLHEQPDYAGEILDHAVVEIIDESGRQLEDGIEGAVRMQLPWQSRQYLADLKKTAEHFVEGYFLPGDKGYKQGRSLHITGRTNLVINLGGVKIDPIAIERFITENFGDFDVVVCEVSQSTKPIKIVHLDSVVVDETAIIEAVAKKFGFRNLLGVASIPAIPRNSMGKPNRQVLSSMLAQEENK